ncbi:MAG: HlyD family efflux transporter periplasmic adaptor subunit [Planctomycetota bacterium]|nr:HlyD family efflux transporter periplasmic adaptor subunit [Planctomycetota bacterium]
MSITEIQDEPRSFEDTHSPRESAIEALVEIAQEVSTPQAFYKRALPAIAQCMRCAYIEVEIRHGSTVLTESWHHAESNREFWAGQAKSVMTETMSENAARARIFEGKDLDVRVAFLCAPVGMHNRNGGALVAAMPCRDTSTVDESLELIDVLCALASSLGDTIRQVAKQELSLEDQREASQEDTTRIRKVAEFATETELAFAITNKLRTRDGCEQVVLSRVLGSTVTMLSMSGSDTISPRSPGVKLIRGAVEECVDLQKTVVDQDQLLDEPGVVVTGGRLHRTWRESVGGGCVASIPISQDEKLVAVLSVRRGSNQPFQAEDLEELRGLVEPYATGLEMVRVARRTLFQHVRSSLATGLLTMFGAGSYGRKVVAAAIISVAWWGFFGQMSYSIQAPCELTPASSRQLAAASDGVLKASFVLPGDAVDNGDLLCEFDSSELELERDRLRGELAILEVDRFDALNNGAPGDAELAAANQRAVQANLALIEYRIFSSKVYATCSGVILEGDHRSRVGDAFAKGEGLFTIAPEDGWKLEILVPESDVETVKSGMTGMFASHSRPEDSFAFAVERVAPAAESRNGNNIFVVEADCEVTAEWARSGMAGFASIDAGERTPVWILTHSAVDFAFPRPWPTAWVRVAWNCVLIWKRVGMCFAVRFPIS